MGPANVLVEHSQEGYIVQVQSTFQGAPQESVAWRHTLEGDEGARAERQAEEVPGHKKQDPENTKENGIG